MSLSVHSLFDTVLCTDTSDVCFLKQNKNMAIIKIILYLKFNEAIRTDLQHDFYTQHATKLYPTVSLVYVKRSRNACVKLFH